MKVSGKYQLGLFWFVLANRLDGVSAGRWSHLGESNPRPIHYE